MIALIQELKVRNEMLFYFTLILLALAALFFILICTSHVLVAGVNAWYKPLKFSLSIAIYCSTMAWYCHYLDGFDTKLFSWVNVLLFGFEICYIAIQASRGQESHFNQSTPVYRLLFGMMAAAAIAITLYAGFVAVRFFQDEMPALPLHYVWAIRLGLIIFVIFSFEGLLMGAAQSHTVGGHAQNTLLPFVKWNMTQGDLRVAHFIGMHALQVLPIASFYLLKNTKATIFFGLCYLSLAVFVLIQAVHGKAFIGSKDYKYGTITKRKKAPENTIR
jgi:hypothetical protein